jgi:ATP/maltotriose-dependent transcriptional regulator MalT
VSQLETQPQVAAYLLDTVQRQLSPAAWQLLTQISVFRRAVNLRDELLIELVQNENGGYDLGHALAELQRRQLIDQPGQATLHPLIRDYVYNTLTTDPARRRRLHQVAAEWADYGLGDSLRAAHHYSQAGQWEQVVELVSEQRAELLEPDQRATAAQLMAEVVRQARRDKNFDTDLLAKAQALQLELTKSA